MAHGVHVPQQPTAIAPAAMMIGFSLRAAHWSATSVRGFSPPCRRALIRMGFEKQPGPGRGYRSHPGRVKRQWSISLSTLDTPCEPCAAFLAMRVGAHRFKREQHPGRPTRPRVTQGDQTRPSATKATQRDQGRPSATKGDQGRPMCARRRWRPATRRHPRSQLSRGPCANQTIGRSGGQALSRSTAGRSGCNKRSRIHRSPRPSGARCATSWPADGASCVLVVRRVASSCNA